MSDDLSGLEDLLEPLYAAVLDAERLADFSTALCALTGSQVGAVMAHDAGRAGGRLELLVGADPVHMAAYEREFASDNPWMQRGQHLMAAGAVVNSDDVATRTELKRTRYYNEYLRLYGIEQSVALCAQADAEGVVVATLCRTGGGAYTGRELALMQQVAPHWANAYAIQRRMSWLEHQVRSLEEAVEASPMAMLMLDGRQRVVRMNPAAEDLLARGDVLRLEQQQPEACFDPGALQQALYGAVSGLQPDGSVARRAGKVVLKDATGHATLVANVHPLTAIGQPSAAVLFLAPVGTDAVAELPATLRQLFGLTASEAALATALLRQGSLAAAAEACGIAASTAQTRLKMVFDKTGEHGQPALMRLLAAVAGACR
ncbi:PAS domain-containing protein [Luteimonas arsenica]|uniref:PAS domain-containing protein n=1 Tax=Luteimonas arsenica TaxID=1586242 RepID=UPI00105682FB|nr:PAS domain-containing protein [Luteimonas arsenica]